MCRHRRTKEETVTLMVLPSFLLLPSCPQLPLKHPGERLLHTTMYVCMYDRAHTAPSALSLERGLAKVRLSLVPVEML